MAKMDWGFEEESQRMLNRLPVSAGSGAGGPSSTTTPDRQPAVPTAVAAGTAARSTFTRAGTAVRAAGNNAIGSLESAVNSATLPVRATVGAARDFTAGVTGRPDRATGQPAPQLSLPRFGGGTGSPAAIGSVGASGPRTRPINGRPAGAPGGAVSALPAGDPNTFTFSDGRTVPVPVAGANTAASAAPRLTRAPAAPLADPQALARTTVADQRGVARQVRGDIANNLVPGSTGDEILRRMQNSQGSYFNRGSPQARAAAAAAYGGQLSALNNASGEFQQGANDALGAGLDGAVDQTLGTQAIEGQARLKRMDTAAALQVGAARDAAPVETVGADGVLRLRRGSTAAPVTDENGNAIQVPRAPQQGAITPQDLLKSYTDARAAIEKGSLNSADKAASLASLETNPLYAQVLGKGQPSAEPPPGAIERLRANPTAAAQFDEMFGPGASARYLGQ